MASAPLTGGKGTLRVKRSRPSAHGKDLHAARLRATGDGSLLRVIKAKQAELEELQRELEEARALLSAILQGPSLMVKDGRATVMRPFRRSVERLNGSPTAEAAYKVLRTARGPLHARDIQARLKARRVNVSVATLVSTLSRWVASRAVFYRAKPNVFGLLERQPPRKGRPTATP
jgi:predicted dehydrogenase